MSKNKNIEETNMADESKVEVKAEAQADEAQEKQPDYAKLRKDYEKTQKELTRLQARAKADEDAKLSETEKMYKELESYKQRASLVDQFEQDYADQRDDLLSGFSEDRRQAMENICDGLDIRKQIKLIKEFAKSAAASDAKAKEADKFESATQRARNAAVHRTPPSNDGQVHFYEDYAALPQAEKFKILKEKGAGYVGKLPSRS